MVIGVRIGHLLIASWPAERDRLARHLPRVLEPTTVDGAYLVSLVGFRYERAGTGALPLPRLCQLNMRTYALYRDEPAVVFLRAYLTSMGFPAAVVGRPFGVVRGGVGPGSVEAPALGVRLRYQAQDPCDAGMLGRHELGIFQHRGRLHVFRIHRAPAEWRCAIPLEETVAGAVVAFGVDPRQAPNLLYAERASFTADLPPRRLPPSTA